MDNTVTIEYDLTGLIPLFNDFFSFDPIKKIKSRPRLTVEVRKRFMALKHKYLPKPENELEKKFLSIRKRKKTSKNSYGGNVASLQQSYYLTHLRRVYIPGNTQWTKGYHKKLKYRRAIPNILIDTKESPRKSGRVGVLQLEDN